MLLFSGLMKLANPARVIEEFARLGYPESLVLGIGMLELACTVVYVIPRTSVVGAIATHVRIGDPFYFPVVFGVLVWLGLFLREERLRALIPLRKVAWVARGTRRSIKPKSLNRPVASRR
jgi:hypothetical protein